jgi:hypothetical protein
MYAGKTSTVLVQEHAVTSGEPSVPDDARRTIAVSTARAVWMTGVIVFAVTVAAFLPGLRNGFVNWDDVANFLQNPYHRGLGWPNLRWMFTPVHMGHYIPVTWLTLGFDYVLWGMNPVGYHFTSIVLHAINAVLFYLLALHLLDLGLAPRSDRARFGSASLRR